MTYLHNYISLNSYEKLVYITNEFMCLQLSSNISFNYARF